MKLNKVSCFLSTKENIRNLCFDVLDVLLLGLKAFWSSKPPDTDPEPAPAWYSA
jgi:hypothetical protein